MGYGDEIMAAGEARRLQAHDPRPVAILDGNGRPRQHLLWRANPRIATPHDVAAGRAVRSVFNGPGCRPYIDYNAMRRDFAAAFPGTAFSTRHRHPSLPWRFTTWRATPGELPGVARRAPGGYVVVEPATKSGASPNKLWGWARWQALVRAIPDLDWVQLGPAGVPLLRGVRYVRTESFLSACEILSGAAAAVLPDGGLHHAAAALGIPAVVIFGGTTSPANLGYDSQVNLFEPADGASPCGQRVECPHCRRAMASIRPEVAAYHLEHQLNVQSASARAR